MWVLQQINAMTMCSAAHETGINSSFMEMSGFPAQRDGEDPNSDMCCRTDTDPNVLSRQNKGVQRKKDKVILASFVQSPAKNSSDCDFIIRPT